MGNERRKMRRKGIYVHGTGKSGIVEWNSYDNPTDNALALYAKIVEDMTPEEREKVKQYFERKFKIE
jgi:hypothetical protein